LQFTNIYARYGEIKIVRTWIIAVGLCIFCVIVPLQGFIIGNGYGVGIQGAMIRYQVTPWGNSVFPLPEELQFVASGLYSGKSAFMVIFWTIGTIILSMTTLFSLLYWNQLPQEYLRYIVAGITGAGILYLASCIAQYGPLFHGPAGISLPIGVLILFLFAVFLHVHQDFLYSEETFSRYFFPEGTDI
jgi:hypothetical protein